jgi:membrane-associated protein
MEQLFNSIQAQFPLIIHYKYLFLLLGASIEGFNVIIFAGFLASISAVAIVPAFLICLAGDYINGWLWYMVGYFGGSQPIDNWGRKDPKSRKIIETIENYFKRYSGRAIIFTKLTWSLTIATNIIAGSFKYDIKKYSLYNFIGGSGWTVLTFTIGYVFGKGYKSINLVNNVGYAALFLALAIGLMFAFKIIFKSKFIQSLTAMEQLRIVGERIRDGIDKMLGE